MKQGIVEYHRTRRQIRKVNREARVEQPNPKRILLKLALILFVIIFAIVEVFSLGAAKKTHDRELAKGLAETATINLSLINASLISNDQTMLKESHQQYQDTLSSLKNNTYVTTEHQELLDQLSRYDEIIATEEKTAYLTNFHTAVLMLEKELQSIDAAKISAKSMNDIKEKFEDFRDKLEMLSDERFAGAISDLTDYSNKLIKLIDKTSVCVGTCSKKTIKSRQSDLAKLLEEYQDKLATYDAEISRYYSPAGLVESLKMLQ